MYLVVICTVLPIAVGTLCVSQVPLPSQGVSRLIGDAEAALPLLTLPTTDNDTIHTRQSTRASTDFSVLLAPAPVGFCAPQTLPQRTSHVAVTDSVSLLSRAESGAGDATPSGAAGLTRNHSAALPAGVAGGIPPHIPVPPPLPAAQCICVGQQAQLQIDVRSKLPAPIALSAVSVRLGCLQPCAPVAQLAPQVAMDAGTSVSGAAGALSLPGFPTKPLDKPSLRDNLLNQVS